MFGLEPTLCITLGLGDSTEMVTFDGLVGTDIVTPVAVVMRLFPLLPDSELKLVGETEGALIETLLPDRAFFCRSCVLVLVMFAQSTVPCFRLARIEGM